MANGLKYTEIVHIVTPAWKGGMEEEADKLGKCVNNLLQTIVERCYKSVAIPHICNSHSNFPVRLGAMVLIDKLFEFVDQN